MSPGQPGQLIQNAGQIFIFFLVPPVILGNGDSGDIVAREGENHTLRCEARGHPKPLIVWRREDGEDIMVRGRKGKHRQQ